MSKITRFKEITGYSYRDIAAILGTTHTTVKKAEKGERNLSVTATAILDALDDFVPRGQTLSPECREKFVTKVAEGRRKVEEAKRRKTRTYTAAARKWNKGRMDREVTAHLFRKDAIPSLRDEKRLKAIAIMAKEITTPQLMARVVTLRSNLAGFDEDIDTLDMIVYMLTRHQPVPRGRRRSKRKNHRIRVRV